MISRLTYLTFLSFIYMMTLIIVYFSKQRIKSEETHIYKLLMISNLFGLILQFLSSVVTYYSNVLPLLLCNFVIKLYFLYFIVFGVLMLWYTLALITDKSKKIIAYFSIIYGILSMAVFFLPITTYVDYNTMIMYSYGISATYGYLLGGSLSIFIVGLMIKNIKKLKSKKSLPLLLYLVLGIIAIVVQRLNPELVIICYVETFITFLMYFTIENPDMKLINELNIAKDAADRANNAKTDFLSSMSHEIRTPLNAIVGFSNGLLEQDLNDQTKEDVNNIITASNNLLELVNGILDISKIEAGKLEIIETNYSFDKMYNELIILTKTRIGEKPIEFRYSKDKAMPEYFYGDGNRLKQIVLNLLTNAAKYTNKGYIDFNVSYVKINERARFIISVSDSGLGISKENLEKLFTKFERLNVEKNTTVEGTGLGLAITKNLIEMMGGKILVDSEEGKGSKFTVIVEQGITTEEEVNKIKAEEEADKVTTNTIDAKGKKVLIVDDNSLNLKVAERLLKKYDIDTETCLSGYECLDKISLGRKYDLILMDDMMPKMNGQETYKKLKNDGNFNTPVVILTANAISGMKEQYLSLGFDDYLSKPIEKPELERVINKYLIK